jgi:hypothetical protein
MDTHKVATHLKAELRRAADSVTTTISFLRAYFAARLTPILGDERGEIASWVVVTALVIVAAITIVGIVVTKLTSTANNIQTP